MPKFFGLIINPIIEKALVCSVQLLSKLVRITERCPMAASSASFFFFFLTPQMQILPKEPLHCRGTGGLYDLFISQLTRVRGLLWGRYLGALKQWYIVQSTFILRLLKVSIKNKAFFEVCLSCVWLLTLKSSGYNAEFIKPYSKQVQTNSSCF